MFKFGKRKVTRQGGSFLISLPMDWMKDIGIELESVLIEMDTDKSLRIAPVTACKQETGASQ